MASKKSMKEVYQEDFEFLMNINEDPISADKLEADLTNTLNKFHQFKQKAKELEQDWVDTVIKTTCPNEGGIDLILTFSTILRSAEILRGKLLWASQRLIMVDAAYKSLVDSEKISQARRQRWLQEGGVHDTNVRDLVPIAITRLDQLGRIIAEMEYELKQAEAKLAAEKQEQANVSMHNIDKGSKKIQETMEEMENLGGKGEVILKKEQLREEGEEAKNLPSNAISDDEYLDKLISDTTSENSRHDESQAGERESNGSYENIALEDAREEPMEHEEQYVPGPVDELEIRRAQLQDDLTRLEYGLERLPKRRIGDATSSRAQPPRRPCTFCNQCGGHYSDSCPDIVSGADRLRFVDYQGLCRYCLEFCEKSCNRENKGCFYCEVVENTILNFLIPEEPHHRALCTVPDSKDRIRLEIWRVRKEIENLEANTYRAPAVSLRDNRY
ncbi:hypothetical protein OSTOST_22115 [Ostertagia ostertagi]